MPRILPAVLLFTLLGSPALADGPADASKKIRILFAEARLQQADLGELQTQAQNADDPGPWTSVLESAKAYNKFVSEFSRISPEDLSARVPELGRKLKVPPEELAAIIPRYEARASAAPWAHGGRSPGAAAPDALEPPPAMPVKGSNGLPSNFGRIADGGGNAPSTEGEPPAQARPGAPAGHPRSSDNPSQSASPLPRRIAAGLDRAVPPASKPPGSRQAAALKGLPEPSAGDDLMPPPDRLMAGKLRGIAAKDPAASSARAYLQQYEALARSGKPAPAALAAWEKEVQGYITFKEGPHYIPSIPDIGALLHGRVDQRVDPVAAENCWQALSHDHPTIAQGCANNPRTTTIWAGVSQAVIDQAKGLVSLQNILMIAGTLLIGGLLSGGVADVIALLLAIGFSAYMVYKIINEYGPRLISAIKDLWNAKSGSKESFQKWKETAYFATTVLVSVIMIYLGAKGAQGLATKLSKLSGASGPSVAALMETMQSPAKLMGEAPGVIPRAANLRAANPELSVGGSLAQATANTARATAAGLKAKFSRSKAAPETAEAPSAAEKPAAAGPNLKEQGEKRASGGESVGETLTRPEPKITPQMADNQARIQTALKDQFELTGEEFGKGPKGPEDFVSKLQKTDALPEPPPKGAPAEAASKMQAARSGAIAKMARDYLGHDGEVVVKPPKNDPLSGAEVYFLEDAKGKPLGVVKVFVDASKGPLTITNELGAARELGASGAKLSKPVKTLGAMVAKDGQIIQIMEAAPGHDFYTIFENLGKEPKAARAAALPEVQAKVETLAKAIAEQHEASRPGKVALEAKAQSVSKALANLDAMKDRMPPEVYGALRERFLKVSEGFINEEIPGRVTHGDFHPGNAFEKDGGITLIDNETLMESVGPRGEGINSPAADVARFVESLRVNNKAKGLNLSEAELGAIERTFIETYQRQMKIDPAAFQAHLDYYRARLQITALKYAKPNSYSAILNEVKLDPALGLSAGTRAEGTLSRFLPDGQKRAVQEAHEVGSGQTGKDGGTAQVGNYTLAQLREKARILKEAGLSLDDRRTLMEQGVVGDPVVPQGNILQPTGAVAREIELLQSSGKVSEVGLADAINGRANELSDMARQRRLDANKYPTADPNYQALLKQAADLEARGAELRRYSSAAYSPRVGKITAPAKPEAVGYTQEVANSLSSPGLREAAAKSPETAKTFLTTLAKSPEPALAGRMKAAYAKGSVPEITAVQNIVKTTLSKGAREAMAQQGIAPADVWAHGTGHKALAGIIKDGSIRSNNPHPGFSGESAHVFAGDIEGASSYASRALQRGENPVLVLIDKKSGLKLSGDALSGEPTLSQIKGFLITDGTKTTFLSREQAMALHDSYTAWTNGFQQGMRRNVPGAWKEFSEWEKLDALLSPKNSNQ